MSETRTPLTGWHTAHGAKMAPFAGWLMPIQYEGIVVEHEHTRRRAGFSTSATWVNSALRDRAPTPRLPAP